MGSKTPGPETFGIRQRAERERRKHAETGYMDTL
jgi:hypothetical protein